MSFLADIYHKSLAENERHILFWEDYLQKLKSLDFSIFTDKLRVPVLVPVGSRVMFRGELKHTNEITVALGADYFVKCSVKQAEVLRLHRIKDAESKLNTFKKEREFIQNQTTFRKENIFDDQGQEIIEAYTEEGERTWRGKHKENVKQWIKKQANEKSQEITDEELWNRLEELELQEELENELRREETVSVKDSQQTFTVKKESIENRMSIDMNEPKAASMTEPEKKVKFANSPPIEQKDDILKMVREKQNELEEALMELRNQNKGKSKTQEDLIAKLDELEKLEELQDEMERLEDIIETEAVTSEEELEEEDARITPEELQAVNLKRRVSFADQDDSESLELTFKHSEVEPSVDPYDSKKGITKPSDIYELFSEKFTEQKSILKKTKYQDKVSNIQLPEVENKMGSKENQLLDEQINLEEKTIVINDVVEKEIINENKLDSTQKRPMSLFKQRRQQKKI